MLADEISAEIESWNTVRYEDRCFMFRSPLQVYSERQEDIWAVASPTLGILGYGPTRDEAVHAFEMDFAACWDLVAMENDNNLTADAIVLKTAMLDLIVNVVHRQ